MTARASGCDCFDCSGEGASWRLLAISGVGNQATRQAGNQAGKAGKAGRQSKSNHHRRCNCTLCAARLIVALPFVQWTAFLTRERVEIQPGWIQKDFHTLPYRSLHNNWAKFVVQNVLIQLLVEGVRSNNLFRKKNFSCGGDTRWLFLFSPLTGDSL